MKMNILRSLLAAFAAFFIAGSAAAQTAGTVTNHAFAIGKGAGQSGFTSLLCASTQIAIGQSAANPACHALSGDVTMSASGVTAIGASKVTNSMLAGSIAASKLVGTDIATVGTVTAGTWQATPVAVTYGGTGATTASAARTNLGVVIGTNVQAWDADLDCLAALATGGVVARTGAGTCATRTVTAPAAGITVSNGDGVAGNPTLALANDLAALEGLSGTGIARRTATDAWSVGAAVANSELATMANNTIKGNISGSTAAPSDLTATQVTAALNAMVGDSGSGGMKGLVPAPASGDASGGKYLKADGTWAVPPGSGGGGSLDGAFGFRNRVINPNGQIWQRANSGAAAITDVTYAFDRWYGLTQSAGITASQVTNAENSTPYMMRLTQANATAQRFGMAQAIESANIIDARGQAVTLSARVKMSAATTLRYAIVEWTGTADAITKDVVNDWTNGTFTAGNFFISTTTTITATGSVALAANTLTTINLTGTVSGSMNNLIVFFWTDSAQAQNATLDVGKVQLEIGSSATPLAVRSLPEEISIAQRYYEKSYNLSTAPGASVGAGSNGLVFAVTANAWIFAAKYSVQKRTTPTLTIYDGAGAAGRNSYYNGSWVNGGVTGTTSTNETSFYVNCVGAATSLYMGFDFTANAEL